jgi:hypothetical protein
VHSNHRRQEPAGGFLAVYEFAIVRFRGFALLRVSLAVELSQAGQLEDAKRVLEGTFRAKSGLRLVALDHPGHREIRPVQRSVRCTSLPNSYSMRVIVTLRRIDGSARLAVISGVAINLMRETDKGAVV